MIHYFNPGHETAVQKQSLSYTAPANIVTMQRELAFLPAWYASAEDCVFVDGCFDNEYSDFLKTSLGFSPKAINRKELSQYVNDKVVLWGISLQAIHYWQNINREFRLNLSTPRWDDSLYDLNSRQIAQKCLVKIIEHIPQISSDIIPRFYDNMDDIEIVVNKSLHKLVSKAPYSSSGRGLLWLPIGELTQTERQILHGILKKQGSLSVERALDKQLDFAMEFMSDGNGDVKFVGYSLFETNNKGAYLGNYLDTQQNIEKLISEKVSTDLLIEVQSKLKLILSDTYASVYTGCIGVDMLIYNDCDKRLLHPCVEINMRYNMGYLATCFCEKYVHPSSHGYYRIDFSAKDGDIYSKHLEMQSDCPAVFENNKLKSGYLPLCPVEKGNHYWAYVVVEY